MNPQDQDQIDEDGNYVLCLSDPIVSGKSTTAWFKRHRRFRTLERAAEAAKKMVHLNWIDGSYGPEVYIIQRVAVVRRSAPPMSMTNFVDGGCHEI